MVEVNPHVLKVKDGNGNWISIPALKETHTVDFEENGDVTIDGSTVAGAERVDQLKNDLTSVISIPITDNSAVVAAHETYQRCKSKNGFVMLQISCRVNNAIPVSNSFVEIASIPSNYAPSTDVYFCILNRGYHEYYMGYIENTGKVYILPKTEIPSASLVRGCVSYIIGQ